MLFYHEGLTTHVDDEYAWAGVEDPKIVCNFRRTRSQIALMLLADVTVGLGTRVLFLKERCVRLEA